MKRRQRPSESSSESLPEAKRRRVSYASFLKWKVDHDREWQTLTWLGCISALEQGKKLVSALCCEICTKYHDRIKGRKNFNEKWITGAESLRSSNVLDHARSEQHKHSMMLLKKEQARSKGLDPTSYAPIARALSRVSEEERARLKRKFDVAYFVANEKLSFKKYAGICDLEIRHGVDLGTTYMNDVACKTFIHFIAEAERQQLGDILAKSEFFSLLMDGSSDKGCCDNEVVMVVWCDCNGKEEKIHTRIRFFNVTRPHTVTGQGLFEVLQAALQNMGMQSVDANYCHRLVGIATDGASANIAGRGLKGLVEQKLPWIFWMWCLAHQMLAIKDALTGTAFDVLDEMLLRLYYLYEKSPKKCRELEEIVSDLKQCLQFDDGGNKPVRASGSRWITHKLSALRRVHIQTI